MLAAAPLSGSGSRRELAAPSLQEMAAQAYIATLVGMGLILAATCPR